MAIFLFVLIFCCSSATAATINEHYGTHNAVMVSTDTSPPNVTTFDPVNGAVNVAKNKTIKVTFNENIKPGNMNIELKNRLGTNITISKSISNNALTIQPKSNLSESLYTLILYTGCVTDLAGNPVASKSSEFSVGTSPTITDINPRNGAVNVALDKTIKVTFSEDIKAGSNYSVELKDNTGNLMPIIKSISGKTLSIDPVSNLSESSYTLILSKGCVTDLAGNPVASKSSKFSSGAPYLTITDPINKAVKVDRNKVITLAFNKPIKAGNMRIYLKTSNGTLVTIYKSISGNVLTIKHTSLLKANTQYTINLYNGCIKDLNGNLVTNKAITFTTGTNIAPSGLSDLITTSFDIINWQTGQYTSSFLPIMHDYALIGITNKGTKTSGNFTMNLYMNNILVNSTKTGEFKPGYTGQFWIDIHNGFITKSTVGIIKSVGGIKAYKFEVILDTKNTVKESDENNNKFVVEKILEPEEPSGLKILDFHIVPNGGSADRSGGHIDYYAESHDIGAVEEFTVQNFSKFPIEMITVQGWNIPDENGEYDGEMSIDNAAGQSIFTFYSKPIPPGGIVKVANEYFNIRGDKLGWIGQKVTLYGYAILPDGSTHYMKAINNGIIFQHAFEIE